MQEIPRDLNLQISVPILLTIEMAANIIFAMNVKKKKGEIKDLGI